MGSFSFAGFLVLFFVFLGGEGCLGAVCDGGGMVDEELRFVWDGFIGVGCRMRV